MRAFDDQMIFQEAVTDWSVIDKAFTDGGDNLSKCMIVYLALTLYRPLKIGQKNQLKLPVINGEIILNPAENINGQTHLRMVDKISSVVTKDKTADFLSIMVRLNPGVH